MAIKKGNRGKKKKTTGQCDIAIIGMACRFPGANNYHEFWQNLEQGISSIQEIPCHRWDTGKYNSSQANDGWDNKKIAKYCGMVEDIDRFDCGFFKISPREANNMDPQHRLLLEEAWHCIEDSGVPLRKLREKTTSVYVGVTGNDYGLVALVGGEKVDSYASVGNFECIAANRISHAFGFSGMSISVDAACASSLVAVHEAKKTLISGESQYAIAAGVCLSYHPWRYVSFSKSRMMSLDGQCKVFDKDADGFVQGEGVGVLLLQPLEEAVQEGNHIYGVIKGSGANHCGHSQTIAAPSVEAQRDVIWAAYKDAGFSPASVTYMEAHGTGTTLGDPIELEALTQAFREHTVKKQFCQIGSVKTNIGHLASAAGVAGIIKVLLMMRYRKIPKTLNLKTVNPIIDFTGTPFIPAYDLDDWRAAQKGQPLRAGVSAFGFGGVNLHVLLEEFNHPGTGSKNLFDNSKHPFIKHPFIKHPLIKQPFILSAKNSDSLAQLVEDWQAFVDSDSYAGTNLSDICSTLLTGREAFPYRWGKMVDSKENLREFLATATDSFSEMDRPWRLKIGETAWNNQTVEEIDKEFDIFKEKLDEMLSRLKELDATLFQGFFGDRWDESYKPVYSFIASYAYISTLIDVGFMPQVVTGEKNGFLVGLAAGGMVKPEDVISLLSGKKELQEISFSRPSCVIQHPVTGEKVMPFNFDETYLGSLTNLSGDFHQVLSRYVDKARLLLENQFTFKKYLEEWDNYLQPLGYTVTGLLRDEQVLSAENTRSGRLKLLLMVAIAGSLRRLNKKWNLTEQKVMDEPKFYELLDLVNDEVMPKEMLVELTTGAAPDLKSIAVELNNRQDKLNMNNPYPLLKSKNENIEEIENISLWVKDGLSEISVPLADEGLCVEFGRLSQNTPRSMTVKIGGRENPAEEFKESLLQLWLRGLDIHWYKIYPESTFKKVPLPVYPFQRETHWLPLATPVAYPTTGIYPLIDVSDSASGESKVFKKELRIEEFFIKDHVVDKKVILPGVAYLELARAAGELAGQRPVQALQDLVWVQPVVMDKPVRHLYIRVHLERNRGKYEVYSKDQGETVIHSRGKILFDSQRDTEPGKFNVEAIKERCRYRIGKEECYQKVFSDLIGFDYGPGFQVTQEAFGGETESIARICLPEDLRNGFSHFGLHPSLIDGALRAITWVGGEEAPKSLVLHIPFALGKLEVFKPLPEICYSYATIVPETQGKKSGARRFNISILSQEGEELIRAEDFTIRAYGEKRQPVSEAEENHGQEPLFYQAGWDKTPLSEENILPQQPEAILVLGRAGGEGERIIDPWKAENKDGTVILVEPGTGYQMLSPGRYRIDPQKPQHYHRLLQELHRNNIYPGSIVHLWSLDSKGLNASDPLAPETVLEQVDLDLENGLYSILYLFQAVTARQEEVKTRCLFVFPGSSEQACPHHEALAGFARSVSTVNHRFELITLQLDPITTKSAAVPHILFNELTASSNRNGTEIRYLKNERMVRKISSFTPPEESTSLPLKFNGVYIVTGGCGGLGMVFARYLAEGFQAKLVLTGRSPLNREKEKQLADLKRQGAGVIYCQADVCKLAEVRQVIQKTKDQFGRVDGIIHCAGVLRDTQVMDASKSHFEEVMAPKIHGTVNLDLATREENLEFLVLFSSISVEVGDSGRCSYATANSFMDRFAVWREYLRKAELRAGKTLSINWPLWQGGGMEISPEEAALYFEYSGMTAMGIELGLQAFETACQSGLSQIMVACGHPGKIGRVLRLDREKGDGKLTNYYSSRPEERNEEISSLLTNEKVSSNEEELLTGAETYLKNLVSQAAGIPVNKINPRADLENYGVDSIMIMELNSLLEKDFDSLPRTLFFEYGNLHDLAGYFVSNYAYRLQEVMGLELKHDTAAPVESKVAGCPSTTFRSSIPGPLDSPGTGIAGEAGPAQKDDIAIIGVSGRYPRAKNLEEFWDNLKNGEDCITEIPGERWDYRRYYEPGKGKSGKVYSKWGGFIDDVDKFDPLFFQISPREAETIDPQERIFLETVCHALEDSGYTKGALVKEKVGVFVGLMYGHYQLYGAEEILKGNIVDLRSSYGSVANRVSYHFGFRGPSLAVDTMCSSSLTSLHLACESIHRGESDLAIAGGVNVTIHPAKYVFLSQQGFASSDGRCRAFGDGGDGYVPGEGVGAILLKPLPKAIADGDNIYAVIKGSALNHGGKTNGYTVPNPKAQSGVILEALEKSGINPRTITCLEAHGTGTSLGDPIEITGLKKAFSQYTGDRQYCSIGSVKSSIGHAEGAAGIASITKVLLQMKHKQLVPSLHTEKLNQNINFPESPFYVQRDLTEWKQPVLKENGKDKVYPRRAGISSFGAGGTNAHVILEEYEPQAGCKTNEQNVSPQIFVLSAKNEDRLKVYADKILEYLKKTFACPRTEENVVRKKLEKGLLALAADVLGIGEKEIQPVVEMGDYGFDQVSFSKLTQGINEKFNLEMTTGLFNSNPSIAEVTKVLIEEHRDHIMQYYKPDTEKAPDDQKAGVVNLADLAYTLQVGREALEERLAIVASEPAELMEKLAAFGKGRRDVEGLYYGNIKSGSKVMDQLFDDDEGEEFIKSIIGKRKSSKLGRLWVAGVDIDFRPLHSHRRPQRVSLPGYPFKKERFWVPSNTGNQYGTGYHPLIDGADLDESLHHGLVFRKKLKSTDLIVAHHIILGKPTLPGIGYLEMAYAALKQVKDAQKFLLSGATWFRPLAVEDEKEVQAVLKEDGKRLQCEIKSLDSGKKTTHCRIEFLYRASGHSRVDHRISIEEVKARCNRRINSDALYARFREIGINYGPYFQGVKDIWVNDRESLSLITLPPEHSGSLEYYTFQPTLVDGALQTTDSLLEVNESGKKKSVLPYAVEQVQILRPVPNRCYAYVEAAGPQRFNVTIVDESGLACMQFKDLFLKEVSDPLDKYLYAPKWVPAGLPLTPAPAKTKGTVLIMGENQNTTLVSDLAHAHTGDQVIKIKLGRVNRQYEDNVREVEVRDPLDLDRCLKEIKDLKTVYFLGGLEPEEPELADVDRLEWSQERGVLSLFRLIKLLSANGFSRHPLELKIITNDVCQVQPGDTIRPYAASLYGLAKSAAKEYVKWSVSCIDISSRDYNPAASTQDRSALAEQILNEPGHPKGNEIAIRHGERYMQVLEPVSLSRWNQTPLRQQGVYLILGGAGGIGLELSNYLAELVQARLVLLGRRELNARQKKKIAALEAKGGKVLYVQADATDLESMKAAVDKAKAYFGRINGAVHSALVLKDKTLENMNENDFRDGLASKVHGSAVLYQALQGEELDFMLFFSSIQSVVGAPGQSNYAAACTFKDAFARALNQKEPYPVQIVNWGYWGSVGVVSGEEYKRRMAAQGVLSIEPAEGMEALQRVLASRQQQVMLVKAEESFLQGMGIVLPSVTGGEKERPEESALHKWAPREEKVSKLTPLPPKSLRGNEVTQYEVTQYEVTQYELTQCEVTQYGVNQYELTQYEVTQYIEEKIVESIVTALGVGVQDIDLENQFSEYGVDSITGLELINSINDSLDLDLRTTILFDYGNIKDLARHICEEHGAGIINTLTPGDTGQESQGPDIEPGQLGEDEQELLLLERLAKGELSPDEVYRLMEVANE